MPKTDKRVDDYIEGSADFAQPILAHLRQLVHTACPDIEETMKWRMPFFEYKGIVCHFASFKKHCAFGFFKQSLLDSELLTEKDNAMGGFGKITSIEALPKDKEIIDLIKQAVKLNIDGVKVAKKPTSENKELFVPEILEKALKKSNAAKEVFAAFSYSHKKEYIEWIDEAKTEATKEKRTAQAIEMMAEGKSRNWKYIKRT